MCAEAQHIYKGIGAARYGTKEKSRARKALKRHKETCQECGKDGAAGG